MSSGLRKLKSADGQVFEVDESILKTSKYLRDLIENNYPDLDQEININQIESKYLCKIIDYLRHYENIKPKKIPKPLTDSNLKSILSQWDYTFINSMSLEECIDLLNGANLLEINGLINLSSAKIASEMLNGPIEQVREKFGIKSDMNPEEQKRYEKYKLE